MQYTAISHSSKYDNSQMKNYVYDGDVTRRPSYGDYISQLIRFARASSHVTDFNNRNKFLMAKLLKQGYRYHKLLKAFPNFIVGTLNWSKNIISV